MLSELAKTQIKEWAYSAFVDNAGHSAEELDAAVRALDQIMVVPDKELIYTEDEPTSFNSDYCEKLNAFFEAKDVSSWNEGLNNVEGLCRKVMRYIKLNEYENPLQYIGQRYWMLYKLMENTGAPFVDEYGNNVNYADGEWKDNWFSPNMLGQYILAYLERNDDSHGKLAKAGKNKRVEAVCTVYVDMAFRFKGHFEGAYNELKTKELFDSKGYCSKVVKEYLNAKTYTQVRWSSQTGKVVKLTDIRNEKRIKLTGPAGVGKSEGFKFIQSLLCSEYIKPGSRRFSFPVLVNLIDLQNNSETPIADYVANKLNAFAVDKKRKVTAEDIKDLMQMPKIGLFLDGYNEILNPLLKNKVCREIVDLCDTCPQAQIWLSDRLEVSEPICMDDKTATRLKLIELSEEEVVDLVNKLAARKFSDDASRKKSVLDVIIEEDEYEPDSFVLTEEFEWLEDKANPIMIDNILDLISSGDTDITRKNFNGKFVEYLLHREITVKRDKNAKALRTYLYDVAGFMSAHGQTTINHGEFNNLMKEGKASEKDRDDIISLALALPVMQTIPGSYDVYEFSKPEYLTHYQVKTSAKPEE